MMGGAWLIGEESRCAMDKKLSKNTRFSERNHPTPAACLAEPTHRMGVAATNRKSIHEGLTHSPPPPFERCIFSCHVCIGTDTSQLTRTRAPAVRLYLTVANGRY